MRICTLCTSDDDKKLRIQKFLRHLQFCGYDRQSILPILYSAIEKAKNYEGPPAKETTLDPTTLFFKLEYHPNDPSSADFQRVWRNKLSTPAHSRLLAKTNNVGIDQMIVCYRRPPNLGNILLSKRKFGFKNGPPVSSFFD